jgi:hypothetical protein
MFIRNSLPCSETPNQKDKAMPKKQSSSMMSSLASKVLSGAKKPTGKDIKKLAASVLGQDEKKGKR